MNSGYENYRLKKVARLCQSAKTVLDIGCADMPNLFLKNQKIIGYDIKPCTLPIHYHDFVQGDVSELKLKFPAESFEAVIAGEIIEHLERPYDFLRDCHFLLQKGGILLVTTPNPNNFFEQVCTIFLIQKYFYDPEHVMLYPQRWLIRMLNRCGFTKVKLYSGGIPTLLGFLIPFPRPWCYQTMAVAVK